MEALSSTTVSSIDEALSRLGVPGDALSTRQREQLGPVDMEPLVAVTH